MLKEHFFASESQKNRVVCLKTTTVNFDNIRNIRYQISVLVEKFGFSLTIILYNIYILYNIIVRSFLPSKWKLISDITDI
jgi:hypothetical protein